MTSAAYIESMFMIVAMRFFFLLRTSGTIVKNIRCVLEDARIIRKEDLNEVRICCRE